MKIYKPVYNLSQENLNNYSNNNYYYFYKHSLLLQNVLKEINIINNKKKYYEFIPLNYDNIDNELYLDSNINYLI